MSTAASLEWVQPQHKWEISGQSSGRQNCSFQGASMPVLDEIDSRIRKDSEWRRTAKAARKPSRITAMQIPLVHVTGKPHFPFLRLCTNYDGRIPTSDGADYCSPATRQKEDEFGFGRSLYFYAGRAHEDYGDVALGFGASVEEGHSGSVTTTGHYASGNHTHLPCCFCCSPPF